MPLWASRDIESGKVHEPASYWRGREPGASNRIGPWYIPRSWDILKGWRRSDGPMFDLTFDRNHNVLLARFAGVFSSEDVESLDRTLTAFISSRIHAWDF
jgi:hypothetical protein